jgi:3-deoxy-7-phosphoheptulonate synthase
MVDCSHGNSQKDHNKQLNVVDNLCEQIRSGNKNIIGVMIESHLQAGRQDHKPSIPLVYGQSITDACIGWEDTVSVLDKLVTTVREK